MCQSKRVSFRSKTEIGKIRILNCVPGPPNTSFSFPLGLRPGQPRGVYADPEGQVPRLPERDVDQRLDTAPPSLHRRQRGQWLGVPVDSVLLGSSTCCFENKDITLNLLDDSS